MATDTPLTVPYTNTLGKPSSTCAMHILRNLGSSGCLLLLLHGVLSTVSLKNMVVFGLGTDGMLYVWRPGSVTVEALVVVLSWSGDGNSRHTTIILC